MADIQSSAQDLIERAGDNPDKLARAVLKQTPEGRVIAWVMSHAWCRQKASAR